MTLEPKDKITLSNIRMDKAREFLDDARATLAEARHKTAINRSYYSALNAVRAILILEGVNPETHVDGSDEAVGKEYLYELDALGDRALGVFGKKMLASARPVADDYVKSRAEDMKITIVDGKNIATLKDNMKQWLNK